MDEVARRARVGRATLYKHFPGRDALIGAVVQTELAKFFAEVQSGVERYDDPDERLVHGFAHAYRLLSHHPAVSPILRLNPEIFLPYVITHDSYALNLGITFRRIIPVEGRPLRGHTHTVCRARRARLPHPDPHPLDRIRTRRARRPGELRAQLPDPRFEPPPRHKARNRLTPTLFILDRPLASAGVQVVTPSSSLASSSPTADSTPAGSE
jgi:AcrR family transcriptional regulator